MPADADPRAHRQGIDARPDGRHGPDDRVAGDERVGLGAHLVVDFHEWSSENVRWNRKLERWETYGYDWKRELQAVERLCLAEASEVITVCDSIADAMAAELGNGRRPVVIRNVPQLNAIPTRDYAPLKQQFGLPDECFVLLYQGGTGTTRLLEPVIEALAVAPR